MTRSGVYLVDRASACSETYAFLAHFADIALARTPKPPSREHRPSHRANACRSTQRATTASPSDRVIRIRDIMRSPMAPTSDVVRQRIAALLYH